MAKNDTRILRCAIYTRKSSEEGLEQAFNSLDAQREACEAYAKSQAHEGWQVLTEFYDDGGFSGGTMNRPALTRLLSDIEQGLVDIIIVYKVDRLSRSLADFVRLIELFDKTGVSFVSVTQQFNTSTSMGRLTLNVLLSFAQFEREVTGERIRDKIAASKKKGMWMGGLVPLGYDRVEKRLVVNEAEAAVVRHIYTRYLSLGCVRSLKAELDAEGYASKPRPEHHKEPGSKPFARGALYTILKNPAYVGKVQHKGQIHDGQHAAILESDLWQAAQLKLAKNRRDKLAKANARYPSLLAGLVYDDKGNRMSPTYSRRKNRHYPYYISQAVLQYREEDAGSVIRLPGKTLDKTVVNLLLELLKSPDRLLDILADHKLSGDILETAIKRAANLTSDWHTLSVTEQISIVNDLVARIVVGRSQIVVKVKQEDLVGRLTGNVCKHSAGGNKKQVTEITITTKVNLRRSGIETKLVYPSGPAPTVHTRSIKALQQALLRSLQWNEALLTGQVCSIDALIERDGLNPRQTHRLRKLAFLSPDIMERIIAGDVPESLTLERLKKDFPLEWRAQQAYFGLSQHLH